MRENEGEAQVTAFVDGRSVGRDDVTVGHAVETVRFYRTSSMPLFAGFQQEWVSGEDPKTETTFELHVGAGVGSRYATLRVEVPGHPPVYEYVDITEVLQERVRKIIEEVIQDA